MMAAVYGTQYNPVSTLETVSQGPCSLRWARDAADAINSAKAHQLNTVLRSQFFLPTRVASGETSQGIYCLEILAPVFVPDGYDKISWTVTAKCTSGDNCNAQLYSMSSLWTKSTTFDKTLVSGFVGESNIAVTSPEWNTYPVCQTLDVSRDNQGLTWLVLTGQASGATYAEFAGLYAWATMSGA